MPPGSCINHSDSPALLYHCGISFAQRDLKPGDELTIDYRLLPAEDGEQGFCDVATGRLPRGLKPRESLPRAARRLVEILDTIHEMP